jgi:FkbM family methyltransferase
MFNFFKKKEKEIVPVEFSYERNFSFEELTDMRVQPPGVNGFVEIENNNFQFHDAASFFVTYKEIFIDRIYEYVSKTENPIILDCGANMGLSVLYFAKKYPNAKIIAFEPEEPIFNILKRNTETYGLSNVTLHKKAVWDIDTVLEFFTDKGMGGSIANKYLNQQPALVQTVVFKDFLHQKIDFLKMDIEGAEYTVLKSCGSLLQNIENIFVEYHSFINQEQHLDDLLLLLKQNGFRYHLKESFSRTTPFTDPFLACENMDLAINIFAYKEIK